MNLEDLKVKDIPEYVMNMSMDEVIVAIFLIVIIIVMIKEMVMKHD
jgi:hypothetical protein